MTNNEIIFECVRATFSPSQLSTLVSAVYTPEQIATHCSSITVESDAAAADEISLAILAADCFHTFAEWKRLGYSVKKGQKSPICCMLWKYTDKPGKAAQEAAAQAGTDAPEHDPHFYRAKSHLFHFLQVEPCKA